MGLDTYKAAGGAIRIDLFREDDQCWLSDRPLLEELASKRLDAAIADEIAAGWAWAEVKPSVGYYDLQAYEREEATARRPTKEEAQGIADAHALVDATARAVAELDREYRAAPADSALELSLETQRDEAVQQHTVLKQHQQELSDSLKQWKPAQLSSCGVVFAIGHDGALNCVRGLVRPEDRKAAKKAKVAALKAAGKPIPEYLQRAGAGERAAISRPLMLDLTAHRTAALMAVLQDHPHAALALVVHSMVVPLFANQHYTPSPLQMKIGLTKHTQLPSRASEFPESRAALALGEALQQWSDRIPGGSPVDIFRWMMVQDTQTLLQLLAVCTANGLDVMHDTERTAFDMSDALAEALSLDMADWWKPTASTYLAGVSKAQLVEAVAEAENPDVARPIEKMSKAEAVAHAQAKLDGKRWLPMPLRRRAENVRDEEVCGDGGEGDD